uniref:Putative ubiquinone oxidoreductase ndufb8/ashi subunit n=1 Tax=Xenopsylla cheopis TaxID=163159 RepID=A0A6M2DUS8_XENCH
MKVAKATALYANKNPAIIYNITRNHWNKDYKPGPYPRTQEERDKAAAKYGLHPKEYKPYPEDEGLGDYPHLPDVGIESRDPYYHYDYPAHRRNYGEPLHADAEVYGEDRFYRGERHLVHPFMQNLVLILVLAGFGVAFILGEKYRFMHPVMPKQYPDQGTHYTFEPLD